MGIANTLWTAHAMLDQGASFEQVVTSMALNGAAGFVGGAAGNAAGGELGGVLVSGAVSGALSNAMMDVAFRKGLGWNVFESAVQGAATSALAWGMKQAMVSEASAAEAQGAGWSGTAETVDSVLAEVGVTGRPILAAEALMDADTADIFRKEGTDPQSVALDDLPKVAERARLASRIVGGLRILFGIDDRVAFNAMRRGEGAYSASEREAEALARRYSTSSGGGGNVVKDVPTKPGRYPHYHGLDASGQRLPGHSWFGKVSSAIFFILDANGDGVVDGRDVFELANPFPVPLETPLQTF
jgi:hypothetical protein